MKAILSENGWDINLSRPTTISGLEYNFQQKNISAEKTIISFDADSGSFQVELQLEK